jgi:hypothetical protein
MREINVKEMELVSGGWGCHHRTSCTPTPTPTCTPTPTPSCTPTPAPVPVPAPF